MRTILGYQDGKAIWSENIPSENPQRGYGLGGHSISDAAPFMTHARTPAPKPVKPPRDYHDSVMKGHETRRLRGLG